MNLMYLNDFFTVLDCFSYFFGHFLWREPRQKVQKTHKNQRFSCLVSFPQVIVDLKTAITLKPEARTKWLSKALVS